MNMKYPLCAFTFAFLSFLLSGCSQRTSDYEGFIRSQRNSVWVYGYKNQVQSEEESHKGGAADSAEDDSAKSTDQGKELVANVAEDQKQVEGDSESGDQELPYSYSLLFRIYRKSFDQFVDVKITGADGVEIVPASIERDVKNELTVHFKPGLDAGIINEAEVRLTVLRGDEELELKSAKFMEAVEQNSNAGRWTLRQQKVEFKTFAGKTHTYYNYY